MNALTKVMLKRLSRAARPYLKSSGLLQVSGVYNRSALVWERMSSSNTLTRLLVAASNKSTPSA